MAKLKRRLTRPRLLESRVIRVACYDEQGKQCEHRVRILPSGRLSLLDHPSGHPSQVLRWHALAGEEPRGCYALLAAVKANGKDRKFVAWRATWSARDAVTGEWLMDAWSSDELRGPFDVHHELRAMLRAGSCHVRRVPGVYQGHGWVVAGDEHTADAIAAHGPPATLCHFFAQPIKTDAGFVKVRVRGLGTVLWDLKLTPVDTLLAQSTSAHEPGPLALVRLTKQLLEGWRGLLS